MIARRRRHDRSRASEAHQRKGWIPDVLIAPEDLEPHCDDEELGVAASVLSLIVEVVSPGKRNQDRDRIRKRREYTASPTAPRSRSPKAPPRGS
ncbi:hypothetical protein SSP24_69120 [Streptomyces spinoverrucosus]|uniref:Uncharacterized protein n=1 Tax=Streptomyces spinoverrucosus TaxID=284043 RepID=A0A4Y3VQX2_9ACTN|nr:hypothetical protein SSP24_69120 [Streptomyces spinoverrucosus]GHB52537.1 hypothetical protein GCM10010397_23070 [Streptomyces spinoverrucosus]